MAIVHEAPNLNEIKIEQYIETEFARKKRSYENKSDSRKTTVLVGGGIILACIGFIAAMIWVPGFLGGMQDWVKNLVLGWGESLASAQFDFSKPEHSMLAGIFWVLVSMLVNLLLGLLGLLLGLISYLMPLVTAIVLFGGAGFIAFLAFGWMTEELVSFDEDRERAYIRSHLPDDLQALQAGVDGEHRTFELVRNLGRDCHVFSNLIVDFGGNHNETDLITVTPTGLTVIEVKNYSGTIQGDLADEELTQIKYSRKGNPYPDTCANPMDQIAVPAKRLEKYLRHEGIRVPVRRCCVFTHDTAALEITDRTGRSKECAMFVLTDPGFIRYLHDARRKTLSQDEISDIVEALERFL